MLSEKAKRQLAIALGTSEASQEVVQVLEDRNKPTPFSVIDYSTEISSEAKLVLNANPKRKYLLIQNQSTKRVWFNFNEPAEPGGRSVLLFPQSTYILEEAKICTDSIYTVSEADTFLIIKEGV